MIAHYIEEERKVLRNNRVVLLFGEIETDEAEDFTQDMEIMVSESIEPITIKISSGGGSVDAGLACIREIQKVQSLGVCIIGEVYGHAQSIAFLILQTCNERTMGTLDLLMAHGITSYTHGDLRNLEAERELLTFWRKEFASLIASRANGSTEEYWENVLEDSTPKYFTSAVAFDLGLIDVVEG